MKFSLASVIVVALCFGVVNGFTIQSQTRPKFAPLFMANKVGVFFGTSTGNTETAAEMIAEKLGAEGPFDVDDDSIVDSLHKYDSLIVGTPTWNTGADTERSGTGWDELYYSSMSDLDLSGKKVAVFGLGDSVSYAENFSDAAGELHDVFEKLGCRMFGYVSQEGYLHEDSKSIRGDKFCGLLLDMVNQEELTEERIEKWVAQLASEGFLDNKDSSSTTEEAVVVAATPLMPDSPVISNAPLHEIGVMGQTLEAENARLREDLDENSSLLDESIASHDTGFTPHTNPVSGRTMWTSADGRKCFFTEGTATIATGKSTDFSP